MGAPRQGQAGWAWLNSPLRLGWPDARRALKAAALCLGTILAAPFAFYYDLTLAPAIAFFAADCLARGFGPWEKTAPAALWLVPLLARSAAQITLIPIGVPVMLALFILLLRRSTSHFASPMAFSGRFLLE
jgi:alpha-1,2-mannosyltransferase